MGSAYNKIRTRLRRWKWFRWFSIKMKTSTLPGFSQVPIYDVLRFVIKEAQRDDLTTRANSMAFSFFISLIPFMIVVFSFTSFIPIGNVFSMIESSLANIMPQEAESYVMGIIDDILREIMAGTKGGLLSIGFILVIVFASNGIMAMMHGFEKSGQEAFRTRGFFRKRLVAIELTVIVGILVILASLLIFTGNFLIDWLRQFFPYGHLSFWSLRVLRWIVLLVLIYSVIAILYRFGPTLKRKSPLISPGATLATILSLLSSFVFSYFVNNFGQYNKFYGSLGALIILLLWIQINCFILLVGFELNASIAIQRKDKQEGEIVHIEAN